MSLRPPRILAPKPADKDPLTAALEHEVLAEKMSTYGRLLKRFEETLVALRAYEQGVSPERPPIGRDASANARRPVRVRPPTGLASGQPEDRLQPASEASGTAVSEYNQAADSNGEYETLITAAGEALWHVVIQRDLCGFRRHDLFFAEYQVPAAARLRMGLTARK
ncbi:MAG: hypothetical protein VX871_06525 [Pseudomonadota bacterium]|nr:hypothetical protein [Pseudomonadota bacterium]